MEKVGDFGMGRSVELSGEDVGNSGYDKDVGKGDLFFNKESFFSEDRVDDVELVSDMFYESLEDSFVVGGFVVEYSVGKIIGDEDFLVGGGLVGVDNGFKFGVRRNEVFVRINFGN